MAGQNDDKARTFTERIEVAGSEAVSTIKKLVADGDVRRIIIRDQQGKQLLAVPMNAGVAVGGIAVLASPTVAAITALVAVLAKVRLEVERTDVNSGGPVVDVEVHDIQVHEPTASGTDTHEGGPAQS